MRRRSSNASSKSNAVPLASPNMVSEEDIALECSQPPLEHARVLDEPDWGPGWEVYTRYVPPSASRDEQWEAQIEGTNEESSAQSKPAVFSNSSQDSRNDHNRSSGRRQLALHISTRSCTGLDSLASSSSSIFPEACITPEIHISTPWKSLSPSSSASTESISRAVPSKQASSSLQPYPSTPGTAKQNWTLFKSPHSQDSLFKPSPHDRPLVTSPLPPTPITARSPPPYHQVRRKNLSISSLRYRRSSRDSEWHTHNYHYVRAQNLRAQQQQANRDKLSPSPCPTPSFSPSSPGSRFSLYSMDEKFHSAPSSVHSPEVQAGSPSSLDSAFESSNDTPRSAISNHSGTGDEQGPKVKKDFRFWMIFIALLLIAFCAALDMTMISTALPAIVADLPVSSIAANWVTSAFLLPMVASQPIFGGLSCSIGRKWSINAALVIFLVGSVVCATAKTLLVLVVGRGIQGLGGGGIHSMCEIIMSDLTTLRERGLYFGLIALVFAIAGFAAPILGGAFSEHSWPWIFWINLPIGAVALTLLVLFLNIRVPLLTGKEKWQRLDLFGNAVLFGSVTAILIAVTEGGIKYHWSDHRVWVPLVVGLIGMGLFLVVEWIPNPLSKKPVFPRDLFENRTVAFSYLQTFLHGVIFYGVIYMIPIYFQAVKSRTPLQSAIWSFPLTAPSFPLAMVAGISISLTGRYKALIFVGWALMAGGLGWITVWRTETAKWEWTISQMICGAGLGIMFPITLPPIQASLPASRLEPATSAYAFTRTFGAVWGITAATTIFSTQAAKHLRPYYDQLNPLGLNDFTIVAYSESLKHLPEPLQGVVKAVYADAISKAYWLFVPLAIIGFVTTMGIKDLPLPDFIKSEAKFECKEDAIPALEKVTVKAAENAGEAPSTMP